MAKKNIAKNENADEHLNLKPLVLSALFAALTAAVAQIKIPLGFTPVPITLQTLLVLLAGAILGPYYGAMSMTIYLALGAIGLPVFAGGSGSIAAFFGPTGGYLLSYPVAAFAVGKILENKRNKFLKYFSFFAIVSLVAIVAADSIFKIGVIPFLLKISDRVRLMVIVLSIFVLLLLFLMVYAKKYFPADIVLAMLAATLIIYAMGALHGKIVTKLPWSAIFVGWVLPFIVGDVIKLLIAAWIADNAVKGLIKIKY
ncbi:biotin transporter BioY [Candidatus Woesearchaeota archaeon]|nr:biotin transporter BioY [Candidatus Woesearchaeota archaeon]